MNTLVIQDFTPDEMEMIRCQRDTGIELFPERDMPADYPAEDVINDFLRKHPNAYRHPTETVRGFPLIIDKTRTQLNSIVGFTGTAYPVFAHLYDTIPAGYAFHAVDVATQSPRLDEVME